MNNPNNPNPVFLEQNDEDFLNGFLPEQDEIDDAQQDFDNIAEAQQYNQKYIRPFPQDKIQYVISVEQLEPDVVYYKLLDNDTNFDRTQLQYLGNPYDDGIIYKFKDNFGHNDIPLTNDSRFIAVYKMFPQSYPNPETDKTKFSPIYGVDPEETTDDDDSSDESDFDSDSDNNSVMSIEGGKKRRRSVKKQKKFHFTSTQKHQHGGKKTVRHVTIRNGKGHKKVSHYRGNKLIRTIKKSLKKPEMEMIRLGKFIPGLFRDCQVSRKKSTTRRMRKK
jgi:hypothetical protein